MTAPLLDRSTGAPGEGDGSWPVPVGEAARVAALRAFNVLDQPQQEDLDAAVRLAAYVCGTPRAEINLVDTDRQWQAAAFGGERGEQPRADSMCAWVIMGSEPVRVPDASKDDRFADNPSVSGALDSVRFYAAAPLVTRDGHSIGTVCAFDTTPGALSDLQLGLLKDISDQVMSLFEMRRMAASLGRIASRDALTGLANRRSAEMAIANAIARAERGLGTPSVVVVDLDGFKPVNDVYGHGVGDAVLRSVADRLTRTARTVDTVARIGGDEFVVLLESTGGPGAVAALGRLRESLAGGWTEVIGDDTVEVGASLGITTYRPGDGVASLIARADAEMYADKARSAAGIS